MALLRSSKLLWSVAVHMNAVSSFLDMHTVAWRISDSRELWSEICDNMFKQYFFKFKQKMIDQNIKHRIETKKIKSKNKIKLAKYQIQN